jgi:hypothetical protein
MGVIKRIRCNFRLIDVSYTRITSGSSGFKFLIKVSYASSGSLFHTSLAMNGQVYT